MTTDARMLELWVAVQRLATAVGELAEVPGDEVATRLEVAVAARRIALEVEMAAGLVLVEV